MNVAFSFTITVACTPRAQPRPRATVRPSKHGGRPFAHIYNPDTSKEFKKAVRSHATPMVAGRAPWDQAVRVSTVVFFERPAWMRCPALDRLTDLPHLETPDRDNVDKAVLDALTAAKVWVDDAQVFAGPPEKFYADVGCQAGVEITVELLELHPDYLAVRRRHLGQLAAAKQKRQGGGAGLFQEAKTTSRPRTPRGRLSTQQARAMGLDIQEGPC